MHSLDALLRFFREKGNHFEIDSNHVESAKKGCQKSLRDVNVIGTGAGAGPSHQDCTDRRSKPDGICLFVQNTAEKHHKGNCDIKMVSIHKVAEHKGDFWIVPRGCRRADRSAVAYDHSVDFVGDAGNPNAGGKNDYSDEGVLPHGNICTHSVVDTTADNEISSKEDQNGRKQLDPVFGPDIREIHCVVAIILAEKVIDQHKRHVGSGNDSGCKEQSFQNGLDTCTNIQGCQAGIPKFLFIENRIYSQAYDRTAGKQEHKYKSKEGALAKRQGTAEIFHKSKAV